MGRGGLFFVGLWGVPAARPRLFCCFALLELWCFEKWGRGWVRVVVEYAFLGGTSHNLFRPPMYRPLSRCEKAGVYEKKQERFFVVAPALCWLGVLSCVIAVGGCAFCVLDVLGR